MRFALRALSASALVLVAGVIIATQGRAGALMQKKTAEPVAALTIRADRPRLFLTPEKKSALSAKRARNDPDYVAMKAYVDTNLPAWMGNSSTLAAGISPADTTITVADGSFLPASSVLVRIGFELISCATRSGNMLTGCTRGSTNSIGIATSVASHERGETAWEHRPGGDYVNLTPMAALLVQLQEPGYATKARGVLSILAMYTMAGKLYQNGNYVRWFVPGVAIAYDWNYANLTTHERTAYAEALRLIARDHISSGYCSQCAKETYAVDIVKRETAIQTSLYGNIANGELQAVLMAAAASFGDNPEAPQQWSAGLKKLTSWLHPAIVDGVASGGNSPEGSEYSGESYLQTFAIFSLIESATGQDVFKRDLENYAAAVARFLIYSTLPGTVKSAQSVVGSINKGASSLVVSTAADFRVGQPIRVELDTPPGVLETTIVGINGNTFTLRDTAVAPGTNKRVTHIHRELTWGDATQNPSFVYGDSNISDDHIASGYRIVDILKGRNAEVSGYVRFWLDEIVRDPAVGTYGKFLRFMYDDRSVASVDYRSLPTLFGVTNPKTTSMLIGRSDWEPTATLVHFLIGGEMYDHTHSHFNSYQIRRGGVWLSNELYGYDTSPFPGVFGTRGAESKYMGARYHNTVLMNGHSSNNGRIMATELTTPAVIERSEITGGYMYARGDASGQYASPMWTSAGYPNNDSKTFIRDFIYIKPDLVAFADSLSYAAATASPTTWISRFSGRPTIDRQRFTSIYGMQKIVQDVVLPEAARVSLVDEIIENPDLDDVRTDPHFRIETSSGVSAASEWSLQVIQMMDSSTPPAPVVSLTTTNANVAQAGDYVLGAMRGNELTFPVRYSYTGRPTHYLMGFAPRTTYNLVDSGSTITITVGAEGSSVTSSPAGLIVYSANNRSIARLAPPAPVSIKVISPFSIR